MRLWSIALLGGALASSVVSAPPPSAAAAAAARRAPEVIVANDNRRPAGTLRGNVLAVTLEARRGVWYPEGPNGAGLDVDAWGEPGKPLQDPGPLVRVRVGTTVRADIRNTLDSALVVYGLGARGARDSVVVAPGETRRVEFRATAPGTFWYAGKTTKRGAGIDGRLTDDSQLNGAIVVDPASAPETPRDRLFLISWWFVVDSTSPTGLARGTMAINGLSWPHTERIDVAQGDSLRWRVINMTFVDHPMHLHGFYFRVDGKGDGQVDTLLAPADRRLAVTELMGPGQTMDVAWAATRPGNWIFHCHFAGHLSTLASLDTRRGKFDEHDVMRHGTMDAPHQMYGLVLGIRVAPRDSQAAVYAAGPAPRALRLIVRERPNVYGGAPGFAYVLGGSAEEADSAAMPVPGPTLVLERNQPVAVTIVNRSREHAAVHWHGIELQQSYPDGVPGWSGSGANIFPSIAPGDSLTVHFTPPRAGTFMYHSHFNEAQQINSGLFGAIVVLDRGERFDTATDRVLVVGSGGPTANPVNGPFAPKTLNGRVQPPPMELRAGTTYRFRVVDIADERPTFLTLTSGGRPVQWQAVAKDGADLPPSQATERPAVLLFDPGEIYDFRFTPSAPGELALGFGMPPFLKIPGEKPTMVRVVVK